jgi:thiol-disulfide isomerase/thioredoxin
MGGLPARAEAESSLLPQFLSNPRSGDVVELSPGAPVLHVVFFATWCSPCRDELPRLRELATRWTDGGYRLVLLAVSTRQSEERLREFIRTAGLDGEILFDSHSAAQRAFNAEQLPTHVLFDSRGTVVARAGELTDDVESTIERIMVEHTRRPGR